MEQGRLARARRAPERDRLVLEQRHVHTVERDDLGFARPVDDGELVTRGNHGERRTGSPPSASASHASGARPSTKVDDPVGRFRDATGVGHVTTVAPFSSRSCAQRVEHDRARSGVELPVGSSASTSGASRAAAAAIATRCCSPPERTDGRCARAGEAEAWRAPRPLAGSASSSRASFSETTTFSRAVRSPHRLPLWRTSGDRASPGRRRAPAPSYGRAVGRRLALLPRTRRRAPPQGAGTCSSPSPSGPRTATNSPRSTRRSRPRSATVSTGAGVVELEDVDATRARASRSRLAARLGLAVEARSTPPEALDHQPVRVDVVDALRRAEVDDGAACLRPGT